MAIVISLPVGKSSVAVTAREGAFKERVYLPALIPREAVRLS
jgi:hypothetical protein